MVRGAKNVRSCMEFQPSGKRMLKRALVADYRRRMPVERISAYPNYFGLCAARLVHESCST